VGEETLWPMWAGGYRTKCATFFIVNKYKKRINRLSKTWQKTKEKCRNLAGINSISHKNYKEKITVVFIKISSLTRKISLPCC
jgi:hypothetical protein